MGDKCTMCGCDVKKEHQSVLTTPEGAYVFCSCLCVWRYLDDPEHRTKLMEGTAIKLTDGAIKISKGRLVDTDYPDNRRN